MGVGGIGFIPSQSHVHGIARKIYRGTGGGLVQGILLVAGHGFVVARGIRGCCCKKDYRLLLLQKGLSVVVVAERRIIGCCCCCKRDYRLLLLQEGL